MLCLMCLQICMSIDTQAARVWILSWGGYGFAGYAIFGITPRNFVWVCSGDSRCRVNERQSKHTHTHKHERPCCLVGSHKYKLLVGYGRARCQGHRALDTHIHSHNGSDGNACGCLEGLLWWGATERNPYPLVNVCIFLSAAHVCYQGGSGPRKNDTRATHVRAKCMCSIIMKRSLARVVWVLLALSFRSAWHYICQKCVTRMYVYVLRAIMYVCFLPHMWRTYMVYCIYDVSWFKGKIVICTLPNRNSNSCENSKAKILRPSRCHCWRIMCAWMGWWIRTNGAFLGTQVDGIYLYNKTHTRNPVYCVCFL